jgi:zinc transporter, ZIP family
MIEAAAWSLLASSSLLIGAALAFLTDLPRHVRGLILAFGAGVLFGSVAYELVQDALEASMTGLDVAIGFALGAVTFYLGSVAIDRLVAPPPVDEMPNPDRRARRVRRAIGLSLLLGAVLDGIPESAVLGLSVVSGEGISFAILLAVFLSNIPEALSASEGLSEGGVPTRTVVQLWIGVSIVSAIAAAIGAAIATISPVTFVILAQAFAAGAILAMLSESALPEAHETGGREVGLASALGFAVAAYLSLRAGA